MLVDLIANINATRHLDVRPDDLTEPFGMDERPGRAGDYAVAPDPGSPVWHIARFDGTTWHAVGCVVGLTWVWVGLREPARAAQDDPLDEWASRTLADMRSKVLRGIEQTRLDAQSAQESSGNGGDEIDLASTRIDHETRLHAMETLRGRLREIDDAIARLSRGEYGICEATGEEIPRARLKANPLARYTVEHQQSLEKAALAFSR